MSLQRSCTVIAGSLIGAGLVSQAQAQSWINFTNQTPSRLIGPSGLTTNDPEEKDLTWGDFDQDGDIDLVIVRKTPFSFAGPKRNVLLMNEGISEGHSINGVLVERTAQYASAADDGGQGMLDATDDRDVVAKDVNGDGWLDIITATTYGAALPKSISHPRVYINRGETDGVWQGFKYEQARIPNLGAAPNFCGLAAGDVTGDKAADLYFTDYDRLTPSPYDDRLLVNDGNGFFTDQSATRVNPISMLNSDFGTAANIADMNGDGWMDIVRSENGPVKTLYNNGAGQFTSMQNTINASVYFVSVGDLNGDGRMDIVMTDDSTDRYFLNTGNNASNQATYSNLTLPNSTGFGSTSRYADLNNDGWTDLLICDVDVDPDTCSRRMNVFRNLGNFPTVTLNNQPAGGIPLSAITGVHDVAPVDLNNDGWIDLVIAQCTGLSVWMSVPPSGLVFSYPQGLPGFVDSGRAHEFQVSLSAVGGTPAPGSGTLFFSVNDAPFTSVPMTALGGDLYQASLPASDCTDIIRFYLTGQLTGGGTFSDPPGAPASFHTAVSADGAEITLEDTLEAGASGWAVANHVSLSGGAWQTADPDGTFNGTTAAAPEDDAGAGTDLVAFVTQNGQPGGAASASDVDGGPAYLFSPTIDLQGTDATISYDRWFYCEDAGTADGDLLLTEVSNNNGASWVQVHSTQGTGGAWQSASFRVGQFVSPTAQVRLRFSTQDLPNNSVTEAGIDNLVVEELVCGGAPPCLPDLAPPTGNGTVDVDDLLAVINAWGPCAAPQACPADIAPPTGNGTVDVDDLLAVINAWGSCP